MYYSIVVIVVFVASYSSTYKSVELLINHGGDFLMTIFDRDLRLYELGDVEVHKIAKVVACVTVLLFFFAFPILHVTLYFLLFSFIDVRTINTIALTMYLVTLVSRYHTVKIPTKSHTIQLLQSDWLNFLSFLYLLINVENVEIFTLSIFYITGKLFFILFTLTTNHQMVYSIVWQKII